MKKDIHLVQKILLLMIGILSIMLMAVLVLKVHEIHQEKLQKEEWEVRHVEVQAEVDDVRMKIQELSEDSEALQTFLEESLKMDEGETGMAPDSEELQEQGEGAEPEEVSEPEAITGIEAEPSQEAEALPEGQATEENASVGAEWDGMTQSGDAILIDIPEMALPQQPALPEEEAVSDNSAVPLPEEETVSDNSVVPLPEEETVSDNSVVPLPEEETVSDNSVVPLPEEETVSGNGNAPLPEEETVSGNGNMLLPEEETVSGNNSTQEPEEETISGNAAGGQEQDPYKTISGNAVVDGKVIPFHYDEAELTLEARRNIRSSYAETEQMNGKDRYIISSSSYDFSNKKIACLGDSITEGSNLDKMENYKQYSYPSVLKNILGAEEVYNLGIGGSSYGRYWDKPFVERYKEIPADTDMILVMGGTNDGFAASEKELGSLSEKKPATFYGDVDELMRGLKENYPEAKIIFATPLPNILHDYLRKQRDYLLPQATFANAVKELAAQYDIDVIDLYNSNLLDTHDVQVISTYMPDGVHGNPAGYQVLAEHMASQVIRIMQEEAVENPTVSGNNVENEGIIIDEGVSGNSSGVPVTEGGEAVSGNGTNISHMEDGKWIDEEMMSEEERAREAQRAEENNKKAAQEAMVVEPAAENNSPAAEGQEGSSANAPGASSTKPEEEEAPMIDYEYDGEAIVIQ